MNNFDNVWVLLLLVHLVQENQFYGKCFNMLCKKTDQTVRTYVMNPKSMPRIQLLGHIDIDTREWSDGVLTAASRAVVKEPLGNK